MKKNKSFIFIFIWLLINSILFSSVYSCAYKGEIDACISANESWTTKAIEDFVCITWTPEEVAYQVIVDLEFKPLDEEMDLFLEELETNKNYYFWIGRKKNYIEALNDIESKRKYFRNWYNKICWKNVVEIAKSCMEDETISVTTSQDYFKVADCNTLLETKLEIFNDVAYSILLLNKTQVKTDEKKLYDQKQRANYDMFLEILSVNFWYLERISKKWPRKLLNTY